MYTKATWIYKKYAKHLKKMIIIPVLFHRYFPDELRTIFSILTERLTSIGRPRIAFRVVTASLFLRLLCPSILNPILFELADEIPDAKVSRTLTLVAKVLQNLANRSR